VQEIAVRGICSVKNATQLRTLVTLAYMYNTKFKWESQVKKAEWRCGGELE
jgi:hypothetical protein